MSLTHLHRDAATHDLLFFFRVKQLEAQLPQLHGLQARRMANQYAKSAERIHDEVQVCIPSRYGVLGFTHLWALPFCGFQEYFSIYQRTMGWSGWRITAMSVLSNSRLFQVCPPCSRGVSAPSSKTDLKTITDQLANKWGTDNVDVVTSDGLLIHDTALFS